MIAALSTLWSFRKAIGIGLAGLFVVAGLWYVRHLQINNARLTIECDRAIQVAKENAAIAAEAQKQAERNEQAVAEVRKAEVARLQKSQKIREDISHAPVTTACVDSPAIRAAFDGLRRTTVPKAAAGQDATSR